MEFVILRQGSESLTLQFPSPLTIFRIGESFDGKELFLDSTFVSVFDYDKSHKIIISLISKNCTEYLLETKFLFEEYLFSYALGLEYLFKFLKKNTRRIYTKFEYKKHVENRIIRLGNEMFQKQIERLPLVPTISRGEMYMGIGGFWFRYVSRETGGSSGIEYYERGSGHFFTGIVNTKTPIFENPTKFMFEFFIELRDNASPSVHFKSPEEIEAASSLIDYFALTEEIEIIYLTIDHLRELNYSTETEPLPLMMLRAVALEHTFLLRRRKMQG